MSVKDEKLFKYLTIAIAQGLTANPAQTQYISQVAGLNGVDANELISTTAVDIAVRMERLVAMVLERED